jgi:hypothetical protein
MEAHAVLLMDTPHFSSKLLAEHAREWYRLGPDHVHLQPAVPEGGRRLEADEARAYDHRVSRPRRALDDGAALLEGAQEMHVRTIRPGHRESPRLGAGRQDQRAIGNRSSTLERDLWPAASMRVAGSLATKAIRCSA